METQTVEQKARLLTDVTFHVWGLPDVWVKQGQELKYTVLRMGMNGADLSLFFRDNEHFKAFVGKLMEEAAKLN